MAGVDDVIGQWIKRAEKSGELTHGKYWGKPFDLNDGFEQTPARLRMVYRILKNAGYVPHEVEMLQTLANTKERLEEQSDPELRQQLKQEIAELEQKISVVIEGFSRP